MIQEARTPSYNTAGSKKEAMLPQSINAFIFPLVELSNLNSMLAVRGGVDKGPSLVSRNPNRTTSANVSVDVLATSGPYLEEQWG